METINIIELFSGIGACSKALERLGFKVNILDAVEIDKYAIKSFNAVHNTNFEPQDITKWNKQFENVDLIMHGSPCQDFSVAGKQAGGDVGSGTRSSLMYETIRIVGKLRPKYVVWENVKNLLSKKHRHNFDNYLKAMEDLGYTNYYQVLNAKDYGIPQNRERVFTISKLDDEPFEFPSKQELKLKLKDMLEDEVDEKYYLSNKMVKYISGTGTANFKNKDSRINLEVARPLTTEQDKRAGTTNYLSDNLPDNYNLIQVGQIYSTEPEIKVLLKSNNKALKETIELNSIDNDVSYIDSYNRKIRSDDISGTITTGVDFRNNTFLAIKNATKKGYDEAIEGDSINLSYPESTTRRGRVGHGVAQTLQCNDLLGVVESINKNAKHQQDLVQSEDDICRTIPAGTHASTPHLLKTIINEPPLMIRKLTPKECWRLMGFDDEDFEKAEKVNSNTQLYKQAGNSIVVNVLEKIFSNLLTTKDYKTPIVGKL